MAKSKMLLAFLSLVVSSSCVSCFFAEKLTGYSGGEQPSATQEVSEKIDRVIENPRDYSAWIALIIAICSTGYIVFNRYKAWRAPSSKADDKQVASAQTSALGEILIGLNSIGKKR